MDDINRLRNPCFWRYSILAVGLETRRLMIILPGERTGLPVAVSHSVVFQRRLEILMKKEKRDKEFEDFVRKVTKVKE